MVLCPLSILRIPCTKKFFLDRGWGLGISVISYQLLKARGNRHSCRRQNLAILLPKKKVRN
ncbi:MAG: hypothetical protein DWQ51_00330 [Microcystis wesenbergii TW10]|uniref:Uncharacterized protein n=1 Tax=Microcystis wesenbergii TW10 TaxID=2060474 RepID=A0A3E0MF18_9CHRO|nr:MAG: hypothetical protein DWQ51_00330 [Microcystis wesenbergii TW10]